MNELQKAYLNKEDTRQLIRVTLVTDGRQRYHAWHCGYCGNQSFSIEGASVYELSDVDDTSWDKGKPRLYVRCPGKFCRTVHIFILK